MPRTSVWFNQDQLHEVHQLFGAEINLSGVVRVALGDLLDRSRGERHGLTKQVVEVRSMAADLLDQLEAAAGARERVKVERSAGQ